MFSKSKCVQNISLVVVGTFTLHNIVKLKKETRIGKKNTEISYCDSSRLTSYTYLLLLQMLLQYKIRTQRPTT